MRPYLIRLIRYLKSIAPIRVTTSDVPGAARPSPRTVTATPEELQKLVAHAQPYMRLFILLASQLGLRITEARKLGPGDYSAEAGTITYRKKGGKTHTLPVTPEIAALFDSAPEAPGKSFIAALRGDERLHQTENLTDPTLRRAWVALRKKAGVNQKLRPHDLRRTVAVSLYDLTKDVLAVNKLLGHTNLASTFHYLAPHDPGKLRPLVHQLFRPTGKETVQ